jgi:hypothetical protein
LGQIFALWRQKKFGNFRNFWFFKKYKFKKKIIKLSKPQNWGKKKPWMQCQEFFNKNFEHHQLMSILIFFWLLSFHT